MRKSLILVFVSILVLGCHVSFAWDSDPDLSAPRSAELATGDAQRVEIDAGAGSLVVRGVDGADRVRAHGTAFADEQKVLDAIRITVERHGDAVVVTTVFPRRTHGNARLDLEVELPAGLPVRVDDGSGDLSVTHVAALDLDDGSGEITVENVAGDVRIDDGSGDLRVSGVGGSVRLDDGSGAIVVRDVAHNVVVGDDGSGDMRITGVGGNVTVEDDGSGSIEVADVRGDFTLENDGSGDVHVDVDGRVRLP